MASNRVQGNKSYAVGPVLVQYDGVPKLFSSYRSTGARMDSYDGRGNGFLFLIASEYALNFDGLSTHGFWDDYEVEDYAWLPDPRYAIRELAEHVTRGAPYTIDYADNFGTNAFASYNNSQMDCSILSSTLEPWGAGGAFIPSIGWWNGGALMPLWYSLREPMFYTSAYSSLNGGCSGRRSYAFGYGMPLWDWRRAGRDTATPTVPTKPTAPLAPRLGGRAPGLRNGSESGAAVSLMRPRFGGSRPGSTATASLVPPVRRQHEPEQDRPSRPTYSAPWRNYDPPPRSPRNESPPSSSERYDAPRAAPVNQAPHFSPPPAPAPQASPPPPKIEASSGKPREP
jgi:hypothetical protein